MILITNYHLKDGGGHKRYILNLAEVLRGSGLKFRVACPPSSNLFKALPDDERLAISFPTKIKEVHTAIKSLVQLIKFCRIYRVRIVHTNGTPDLRFGALLKLYLALVHRVRVCIVFTKHDLKSYRPFNPNQAIFRFLVSKIICPCPGLHHLWGVHAPSIQGKVCVVPHGVDVPILAPESSTPVTRAPGRDRPMTLVSCAGTNASKGWAKLIKALETLKVDIPLRVVVLGHRPENLAPKMQIREGLRAELIFPGFVDDIKPFLAQADIGFVLSDSETISYACLEMMAASLPVWVTNVGCMGSNVEHGVSGWVSDNSHADISKTLDEILATSVADLRAMGLNAQRRALGLFGLGLYGNRMIGLYEDSGLLN